jgi:A/G-specific adenine glycosylase
MNFFNSQIHIWYSLFKRELPWRNTRNPYYIWLSEIILQQTRIDQGLAYYNRFIDEFPEISDLASASEDQVLKLWQGLGYYSRARNLHFTAKFIMKTYNGEFPEDYQSIRSLKGIGDYTAAAISSISYGLEFSAVDGNVFRVLSRYFGISEPIDTSAGKKIFNQLAKELIKGTDPGMHNQAIMEFGAIQCVPKNPKCTDCPVRERCYAYSSQKINELPAKKNKTKVRDRYFNYLVLLNKNHIWFRKRVANDIWKNLFEFPLIETAEKTEIESFIDRKEFQDIINTEQTIIESTSNWKIHILSHQRIHYRFIRIRLTGIIPESDEFVQVNKEDIFNFAVPKLLETYLADNFENVFFIS